MPIRKYEVFREVFRIVEKRGGAVYKTEYVESKWIDEYEVEHPPPGYQYVVPNSPDTPTIRRVL